ncbi:MAG: aldo/keto reductase [Sulfuricurvum sp.]|jgi:aryl-alcohol dehydrogenase-like predicted oxidoreductase|uniref:aldo/keto reductase n=1 Tax=Sulfuricurvum sp. TaxID=2025608 RepID=UPI0025F1F4F7|nr:aldo/keto reductase [Sulfuricurvum sp.]MCK9374307.1 aldo/keto reductase [Sulfuricurvum sp.]
MKQATKEGTFSYLKKFGTYSKDFYRFNGELFFPSLGLGTYKPEPYKEENYIINFSEAIKTALRNGINLIDTAINYRYQMSEREIGEALAEMFKTGEITREEVIIASKAGFIPLDFPFPDNPYGWIQETIVTPGLAKKEEIIIDQHCMSPKYLRWSCEQSLQNLGLEALDILFLHNPETQLGYIDTQTFYERIEEAFTLFETLRGEGKIGAYGIAAWNGFLYEEEHTEYISLARIVEIARRIGGEDHGFKYLQSPFNLAKPHAYAYANQQGEDGMYIPLMHACARFGITYMGSSPLLQKNLFKRPFAAKIGELMRTSDLSDVTSALQFARSAGAISTVFGAVEPSHVIDNTILAHIPAASIEAMEILMRDSYDV